MFDDTEHNPFERASGKGTLLTVVVHTASFEDAILAEDPLVQRFFQLSHGRYLIEKPEPRRVLAQLPDDTLPED